MKKRALVSVSDKAGIVEFCQRLVACGYEIISTGGTAKAFTKFNNARFLRNTYQRSFFHN